MSDEHKPVVQQEQPSIETAPKPTEKNQKLVRQSETRFEATSGFLPPPQATKAVNVRAKSRNDRNFLVCIFYIFLIFNN